MRLSYREVVYLLLWHLQRVKGCCENEVLLLRGYLTEAMTIVLVSLCRDTLEAWLLFMRRTMKQSLDHLLWPWV